MWIVPDPGYDMEEVDNPHKSVIEYLPSSKQWSYILAAGLGFVVGNTILLLVAYFTGVL